MGSMKYIHVSRNNYTHDNHFIPAWMFNVIYITLNIQHISINTEWKSKKKKNIY